MSEIDLQVRAQDAEGSSLPYLARWAESVQRPWGSTDMRNPDTATENKNTEDHDT